MIEIPEGKQLFVVFAMMRSGSNLLQQKLNAIDGVLCHGEIFNSSQDGFEHQFKKDRSKVETMKKIDRVGRPCDYLKQMINLSDTEHMGFRLFENHHDGLVSQLVSDDRIFKIILIRNFLDAFVSLKIAQQNDQWIMNQIGTRKTWKPVEVKFDAFKTFALRQSLYYYNIISRCTAENQKFMVLDYLEMDTPAGDRKLLECFGENRSLDSGRVTALRQNPEPLRDKILNFDELRSKLVSARLDHWLLDGDR